MRILNYLGFEKKIGKKTGNYGFTLVELLVVMSLTMILTGGLLFYNRTSENQLILYREDARIIGALQQAKTMTFGIFAEKNQLICGYGVHFEKSGSITVFRSLSPTASSTCFDANKIYNTPNAKCDSVSAPECVSQTALDKTVQFSDLPLNDIVFIPPDPVVIINNDSSVAKSYIKIKQVGGILEKEIDVNNFGQITEK